MTTVDFSRQSNSEEIVPEAIIDLKKANDLALDRLTAPQEQAVKHDGSPLLILAGAGTGKTRCLTARISYRIANQLITPANVLAITFTRKAAKEMKKRLEGIIGPTAKALDIGTFHSICSTVLRNNVEMSRLKQGFSTLTDDDQRKILRDIHQNRLADQVDIELQMANVAENVREKIKEIVQTNGTKASITALYRFAAAAIIELNDIKIAETRIKKIMSRVMPKNFESGFSITQIGAIVAEEAKLNNVITPDYASEIETAINLIDTTEYDSDEILTEIANFKQRRALAPSYDEEPEAEDYVKDYIKRLEASNSADYTDLIADVCRMFRDQPRVLEYYRQLWTSIYIDEYQDTDELQEHFIALLADITNNETDLTVVGDDDQSVYSWRNAKIENILTFNERRPGSKLIRLEENFRSNQGILDTANNLISYNEKRLGKKLFSANKKTDTVRKMSGNTAFANEYQERDHIIEKIKVLRKAGVNLSEIAIISRTAMVINPFQNSLIMNNIPFTFTAGRKFTETEKVKTIIAYMRLMRNESDDAAFQAAFSSRPRSFGEKSLEDIIRQAQIKGVTARQMLEMSVIAGKIKSKAIAEISEFFNTIGEMKEMMDEIILHGYRLGVIDPGTDEYNQSHAEMISKTKLLIDKIQIDMQIETEIQKLESKAENSNDKRDSDKFTKDAKTIRDNIDQLTRVIVDMQDIDGFLDSITLTRADDEDAEGVWVGTIHAAKGLEFDYVFLPGWEEEIFPSPKSEGSIGGIDEERRLAYVALTRPRKNCIVSSVIDLRVYLSQKLGEQGKRMHKPSNFFSEMEQEAQT